MLFKIDVCFIEQKRAVEIDEKAHLERDLIFEEKRQEALAKKPNCEFIWINISTESYDPNYEISRIQIFISKFKNRQLRKLKKNQAKK